MNSTSAVKWFALAVVSTAILASQSVDAQQRISKVHSHSHHHGHSHSAQRVKIHPSAPPRVIDHDRDLPRLGFYGYVTHEGMVITRVVRGSEAFRIGLEEGDIIQSINGYRLCHEGDYERALSRAGRHLDLHVKDVRGRGVYLLHAHVDNVPQYYSQRY